MKYFAALVFLLPSLALADQYGELNPDEMTLNKSIERAINGDVDMVVCAQGYLATKSGRHEKARQIFENCAKAGYTGTMTWMAYMEQNGFGKPEDPKQAAEWDKQAADAGDPIGKFNYGLNLLRGYGVTENPKEGRAYIDQAAQDGLEIAIELQNANYDLDVVTPDADEWKFRPMF